MSRQKLIEQLKLIQAIRSPIVEAAFQTVPRHLFVPNTEISLAYQNQPIFIEEPNGESLISSASMPSIVAYMLELLQLSPGQRVLEIGAGTGYNAALMNYIVGETGQIVTIDNVEYLATLARQNLRSADSGKVEVILGDGSFGYSKLAPYDRIILSVGTWDILPAWYEQLDCQGKIVLPLSIRGLQFISVFEPKDGYLEGFLNNFCGFMRMSGFSAEQLINFSLNGEDENQLEFYSNDLVDKETILRTLEGPKSRTSTGIHLGNAAFVLGLQLWLAINEPNFCILPTRKGLYDSLVGLYKNESIHLLELNYSSDDSKGKEDLTNGEIFIHSINDSKEAEVHHLIDLINSWKEAGYPYTGNLRVKAYPVQSEYVPSSQEKMIITPNTKFIFSKTP